MAIANPDATVWRQFDRIGPPYPDRGVVLAVRDTAQAILDDERNTAKDRALAAFVLAHTYIAAGESGKVLPLLRRAVALDPTNRGFRDLLDHYAAGDRP